LSEYKSKLEQGSFQISLQSLIDTVNGASNSTFIDQNVLEFSSIMGNVCEPLFRKCSGKKYTKKNSTSQQWFDTDCRTKRNKFYDDLKNYKRNKNEVNRIRLSDSRSEYKKKDK
jgi:hypothetical protein